MNDYSENFTVYIGTYTNHNSKGIYIINFNIATGKLDVIGIADELENPSYLNISKDNKYLYTVSETEEFNGTPGGAVGAYSINSLTGRLSFLNVQPTRGRLPCHLTNDSEGKFLIAANYGEGTISVFPLQLDGSIASISSVITHQGKGPDKERQEKPHVHHISLTPDEKYLCAVDLGIDKICMYDFELSIKNSVINKEDCQATFSEKVTKVNKFNKNSIDIFPGSGPRHLEFSRNGKYAYLVNELTSSVVVLSYSSLDNTFTQVQYISALPATYIGISYCAAIHISPDNKFLYVSNRGHDSIAIFEIDQDTGKLAMISLTSTNGKFPRDFAIDPLGNILLVANQHSDTIVPFRIQHESGKLEVCGDAITVPSPVCVKFNHKL